MHDFTLLTIDWYRQNKRDLPWRSTKDPYKIWLSEIILQQTRVDQGLPYYHKFIENFPYISDLAKSDEQKILKLWQGLGYYSRARNLHFAAQQVMKQHNGVFPTDYNAIRALKGIGDYTAAAIASFAYDLPHAVVDGNVYRVLARYYNDETPIDSSEGKKLFASYAHQLLPTDNPAEFNQAIMELGALICTPKLTQCNQCPVQETCGAFRQNKVAQLPVKSKKTKVTERFFNYLFIENDGFYLIKRDDQGIWRNMYELPLIENSTLERSSNINALAKKKWGVELVHITPSANYKHILSHQHIHAQFWEARLINKELPKGLIKVTANDFHEFPLPKLIQRYLEEKKGYS